MLVIADISGNHGGHLDKAIELIEAAAAAGCDYAKFQMYHPEEMYATSDAEKGLYRRLAVPVDWLDPLFDSADHAGIGLFASVFSVDAIDYLRPFRPRYWKFASPQSTWLPASVYTAMMKALPENAALIYSVDSRDIDRMWHLLRSVGRADVSSYTLYCPPGHPPIITSDHIDGYWGDAYHGFSDHTNDLIAPLAFAAAGARIIEKHLKIDDNCVDAAFAADPYTMAKLCDILK